MARPRSKSRDELVNSAMWVFWHNGFDATSVEDLVSSTGVGRGALYSDFGGKEELFLACLRAYREHIAENAIGVLYQEPLGMTAIANYFDHFIRMHETRGLPGPGCFLANTMTELAPHQAAVQVMVEEHMAALKRALEVNIKHAASHTSHKLSEETLDDLARITAVASQGLWSYARGIEDIKILRRFKVSYLEMLQAAINQ